MNDPNEPPADQCNWCRIRSANAEGICGQCVMETNKWVAEYVATLPRPDLDPEHPLNDPSPTIC
jgi:hypothetical protein